MYNTFNNTFRSIWGLTQPTRSAADKWTDRQVDGQGLVVICNAVSCRNSHTKYLHMMKTKNPTAIKMRTTVVKRRCTIKHIILAVVHCREKLCSRCRLGHYYCQQHIFIFYM